MKQQKEIKQNYKHYEGGEERKRIEQKLNNLLIDDEIYWKQRSRVDWIREGEKTPSSSIPKKQPGKGRIRSEVS